MRIAALFISLAFLGITVSCKGASSPVGPRSEALAETGISLVIPQPYSVARAFCDSSLGHRVLNFAMTDPAEPRFPGTGNGLMLSIYELGYPLPHSFVSTHLAETMDEIVARLEADQWIVEVRTQRRVAGRSSIVIEAVTTSGETLRQEAWVSLEDGKIVGLLSISQLRDVPRGTQERVFRTMLDTMEFRGVAIICPDH